MGRLLTFAIDRRDLPLLQAITLLAVLAFLCPTGSRPPLCHPQPAHPPGIGLKYALRFLRRDRPHSTPRPRAAQPGRAPPFLRGGMNCLPLRSGGIEGGALAGPGRKLKPTLRFLKPACLAGGLPLKPGAQGGGPQRCRSTQETKMKDIFTPLALRSSTCSTRLNASKSTWPRWRFCGAPASASTKTRRSPC